MCITYPVDIDGIWLEVEGLQEWRNINDGAVHGEESVAPQTPHTPTQTAVRGRTTEPSNHDEDEYVHKRPATARRE